MQSREITLIQSSIDNGRIYFPITDAKFFPADSLADRSGSGHTGELIVFIAGALRIEIDIRISSGQRLSPRRTFAKYLKSLNAAAGERLQISRTGEREYHVKRATP